MTELIRRYGIIKQEEGEQLAGQLTEGLMGDMVVTPREIDELVLNIAGLLSDGINQALQPAIDADTLHSYLHI